MEHFSRIFNRDTEISQNTACSCCGEGLRMKGKVANYAGAACDSLPDEWDAGFNSAGADLCTAHRQPILERTDFSVVSFLFP